MSQKSEPSDEENNGLEELIDVAESSYGIPKEKIESLIEPSFEKAKELAKMIV